MTPRPVTDEQLAAGLRAHLPASTPPCASGSSPRSRPRRRSGLPSILGRLNDADPVARRRTILLVALLALALAASAVATAGALLREQRTPDLSLDPPAELPVFVRSAYDDMPKLQP